MRSVIRMSGIALATLLLSLLFLDSQSVQAATLTVSTTADGGNGSLRQAIIDATANAEANTINFDIPLDDPGYSALTDRFTITLATQLPDLPLAPLTIDNSTGRGVTVTGDNTFRIFTLVNSAVVNLTNLTISQGSSNGGLGGGIYMGDSSILFLTNCVVTDNSATNGGGGIWVNDSGTLNIFDSTIRNNTATTGNGGGIYLNNSGTLNITSSTVSDNHATVGSGGGIYNGVSGTVNATNITVSGNTAGNLGGGINNSATATISSSTISGNTAASGGGGMYNGFTATLNNSLVALNTAADGPDLLGRGSLGNPFTGNSNLVGNADGSEGFGPTTNQLGSTAIPINPRLGPLQDNGGVTFTQALLVCSPAIDAGDTALVFDQRGESRPQDGDGLAGAQSDIGAFEVQEPLVCNIAFNVGEVLISEFRFRGPTYDSEVGVDGSRDEYIDLYNNTDASITVSTTDGSAGWTVAALGTDGTSVVPLVTIPAGTVIPARTHYLVVNSDQPLDPATGGYTLDDYATPDAYYLPDIGDNVGVALFNTAIVANFVLGTRMDAAGFSDLSGSTAELFREGAGLTSPGENDGEYAFVRILTTGFPKDSDDNSQDFIFISTDGGSYGGVQSRLGAPGPENMAGPIQRNATVKASAVDPQCSGASNDPATACGRVRDTTDTGVNKSLGTLSFRRKFTNQTGQVLTRLRFRLVDITAGPGVPGVADLRALDTVDVSLTRTDNQPVMVRGTTVETPPAQVMGGAQNTTMTVGAISLASPLVPGASVDLQFLLGVQAGGGFRFFVNVEALADTPVAPGRTDHFRKKGSSKAMGRSASASARMSIADMKQK